MEAYKFETTVLENGIIRLPEISKFANCKIEIFIVIKQPENYSDTRKKRTIEQFLDKWTGFLEETNPDESKHKYLTKK